MRSSILCVFILNFRASLQKVDSIHHEEHEGFKHQLLRDLRGAILTYETHNTFA